MTTGESGIAAAFDARAATYARSAWHGQAAERLITLCGLEHGMRVLDAATGTGFASLAAAQAVGDTGHVIGIDLSSGMLRQAAAAARSRALRNIDLAACRETLEAAGFDIVSITREPVTFSTRDFAQAWDANFRSPGHAPVLPLSEQQRAAFRARYLERLGDLERETPRRLVESRILYAVGRKPQT